MQLTGLTGDVEFANQQDRTMWPKLKQRLTAVFATKSQAQWCQIMEGTDVCFAPVLTMSEAAKHPHNVARQTFIEVDGVVQPAPAPRFSRTEATVSHGPVAAGENTREVLQSWGVENVDNLITRGVVKQSTGGK
jgi:alpha-methylacyl-CoA racemase